MDTTLDGLLNRRVALEQPAQGFRVAVDTVLLAAAVSAKAGDRVLELGCGVGGAMLCLACRVAGVAITGLELQPELAELCRRNIERNAFDAEMKVVQGDATQIPDVFINTFDHVVMNPPYHSEARHDVSPNTIKRAANSEKTGDLEKWLASAALALKPEGVMTLIHRADRLDEIQGIAIKLLGSIDIIHIVPKTGATAQRLIVRARKDGQLAVTQYASLIMHRAEGGYTEAADNILRHAKPIDFLVVMT